MMDVASFVKCFNENGITFFVGVPDSLLKSFCAYVTDNCGDNHMIAVNEGGAVPPGAMMHDVWIALVAAAFGAIGFVDQPLLPYRQHGENSHGETPYKSIHCWRRAKEGISSFWRRLSANIAQARAFVDRFCAASPECVRALAQFPDVGYWRQHVETFRHGLFKHGVLRNAALVLLA